MWRAPYHRTLYELYQLEQQERFDELRERQRTLRLSSMIALAFHEPKRLGDEHRQLLLDAAGGVTEAEVSAGRTLLADLRAAGWSTTSESER